MLAKCASPACSASFRHFKEGKLYRLEPDSLLNPVERRRPEYFWLCSACSAVMTLRLNEAGEVVAVPVQTQIERVVRRVELVPLDRKRGVVLSRLLTLAPQKLSHTAPVKKHAAHAS